MNQRQRAGHKAMSYGTLFVFEQSSVVLFPDVFVLSNLVPTWVFSFVSRLNQRQQAWAESNVCWNTLSCIRVM